LESSYNLALEMCQVHISLMCISHLENFALEEEGLFRIPGSNAKGQEWKHLVDSGLEIDFVGTSSHDVASFLKMYLRELPNGLILSKDFKRYSQLGATQSTDLDALTQLISELPHTNKLILYKLISLLNKIDSHSAINKMNTTNLSRCLATNVLKEPESEDTLESILENTLNIQKVFQILISESTTIWTKVGLQ